jgi:nitronate monooxygenase
MRALAEHEPGRRTGQLAVNISVGMARDSRDAALDACRRHKVELVVTAGGNPAEMVKAVHGWGGRLFHDITSVRFAEKALEAGVDGMIAIGAGGGGHSGVLSHLTLVPQIRRFFSGTLVMAGAVANGAAVRAAEVLGADLAYMGTRFIATQESMAPAEYKQLLVSQMPGDLIYSRNVNGLPAMWLRESLRMLGLDPDNLPIPAGHNTDHLPPHVKPWSNLYSAGQGIGLIEDIPTVAALALRLQDEYRAACEVPAFHQREGA